MIFLIKSNLGNVLYNLIIKSGVQVRWKANEAIKLISSWANKNSEIIATALHIILFNVFIGFYLPVFKNKYYRYPGSEYISEILVDLIYCCDCLTLLNDQQRYCKKCALFRFCLYSDCPSTYTWFPFSRYLIAMSARP